MLTALRLIVPLLAALLLTACSPTYLVTVENRAGTTVDARFVYDRYMQNPQVLQSARLSDGEQTEFGPFELVAFEEVFVEVVPARDPYELPARFRVEDREGRLIIEANGIEAVRPLALRWDLTKPNEQPLYTHPGSD